MKEHYIGVHFIKISANFSEQRIDNFLHVYLKKVPKSMIYRIIRTGEIRVNKKKVKFYYKLKIGDLLKIPSIELVKISQCPVYSKKEIMCLQNSIIYEDDFLLVLNKPSGVPVHGGSGLRFNIIDGFRKILNTKTQFLELVHRLDRDTSGILLLAKNRTVLMDLHEQWRFQKIQKEYLALVYGTWNIHLTSISIPLLKKKFLNCNKITNIAVVDLIYGKPTKTYFRIKEYFSNLATLLVINPITGRTHQIRAHTQQATHPVIGDQIYGNYHSNMQFKKLGLSRLFLHASKLCFIHPNTKKKLHIYASIDKSFCNCLYFLRNINTSFNSIIG